MPRKPRQIRNKTLGTKPAVKATPEVINAILRRLARGLTREQACAASGINRSALQEWEKRPEFPDLRAKVEAARIEALLDKIDNCKGYGGDWNRFKWQLQKNFPKQFGDDSLLLMAQQNNFYQLPEERVKEINERVQRLLGDAND